MKKVITGRRHWLVGTVALAALASATAVAAKNWSEWSAAASVETLPNSSLSVNTASVDGCASHSPDGLTLIFNSSRGGNQDLYIATRPSTSQGFGAPVPLSDAINSVKNEACPTLASGHRLYFSSDRHDPAYDLYVSRKLPGRDWSAPVRLGQNINTNGMLEETADFYEDEEGREVMIFTRRPPGGLAGVGGNLYQSIAGGPASLIQGGPISNADDNRASVTKDGLTIFWDSTRQGLDRGPDLFTATRSRTSDDFGDAVHLDTISSDKFDGRPFISKDGTFLTFASSRTGSESVLPDIYFVTREKVTGN